MDADISTIALDYEFVSLRNEGPVKIVFRRKQVSVAQANLRGTDSDFHISGSARFDGTRPINMDVTGKVKPAVAGGNFAGFECARRGGCACGGRGNHDDAVDYRARGAHRCFGKL